MKFIFIFGNTPKLAKFELESTFTRLNLSYDLLSEGEQFSIIESENDLSLLFDLLGGVYKVAEIIANVDENILAKTISDVLAIGERGVDFGLSLVTNQRSGNVSLQNLCKEIKELLSKQGIKSRFVLPVDGLMLSSVVVKKQKINEIILIENGNEYILGKIIWVSNFEDWNKRDYGRPMINSWLGMLTPKVARMMVNSAIANFQSPITNFTILDPFCGVGTVAIEVLTMGCSVMAADINRGQIEKCKANIEWAQNNLFESGVNYKIIHSDARRISRKLEKNSIDGIVTEPDLGPDRRKWSQNIQWNSANRYLIELYVECFKDWLNILRPNAVAVIALPSFVSLKNVDQDVVKIVIDKVKLMGYSLIGGPFEYFRPQAVVRRNICIFKLNYGTY